VGNFPISFLYAICKELLDFAIVQNFSQKKKPLVMDTFHNIYYIMKITISTKLTRCMKKKKHIDEIDQMMKLG
jgi:hypothetical protein